VIDRAVVLAAGAGTRLGDLTATEPKPLLDVAGASALSRVLDGVAQAGIHRIALITGHGFQAVEDAAWGYRGLSVEFIRQEELNGTGGAMRLARGFTYDEPFLFAWSDVMVAPVNYAAVVVAADDGDTVIAVNHVDDPSAGAAVHLDDDGWVTGIEEKPRPGTAGTNWNSAGLGILNPSVWPHLDVLEPSERGELELTDALASLLLAGERIRAVPVRGYWHDIGTPEGLAAARDEIGGIPDRRR
jgi:dTDP-glucose pyrophosphorylase